MNDRLFKDQIRHDTRKVKEDINTLVGDGASKLSESVEKLARNTKENLLVSATAVKKDVGHGLDQYNARAQKTADKVSGDFGKLAARYPWVSISIALVVGILLGGLLKPARQVVE